jgi:clan AA aspartic protease (TIGR02281 family)
MVRITVIACAVFVALIGVLAAVRFNPHDWFPDEQGAQNHARIAKSLSLDENDTEAIAEYKKAVDLAPKNATIRFDYAKALERAGEQSAAAKEISIATNLAPNDKKLQYQHAYFLDRSGEPEAALKQYEKLLASPIKDLELRKNVLYFAAKDYELVGQHKKALELYKADLKLETDLNGAWLGVARCQHNLGKTRDAVATLRRATQRLPDDSKVRFEFAEMLAADNQKQAAIREVGKSVQLNPDYAEDADDFVANLTTGKGDGVLRIPLERVGNSFVVRVMLNRAVEATLVVDSGADVCMISKNLADKLNLDLNDSDQSVVSGVAGEAVVQKTVLDTVRIGPATHHNIRVAVHDLPSGEDGLLGMNLLEKYNFSIDSSRQLLQLSRRPLSTM